MPPSFWAHCGYTQAGGLSSFLVNDPAEAFRLDGLEYEVISGVVAPDRNTHVYVMGLRRLANGELGVFFVGTGYSGGPEGRIVPDLTP